MHKQRGGAISPTIEVHVHRTVLHPLLQLICPHEGQLKLRELSCWGALHAPGLQRW